MNICLTPFFQSSNASDPENYITLGMTVKIGKKSAGLGRSSVTILSQGILGMILRGLISLGPNKN